MAFRTTTSLAVEYERLKAFARHLRAQALRHKSTTDLPTVINELLPLLREASSRFASVPSGMAAFAQAQEDDPAYDVVAQFTAMKAAVDDALVTLISGIPRDGEGYVLDRQMGGQGNVTGRELTAGQISALATKLDAVITTIEG